MPKPPVGSLKLDVTLDHDFDGMVEFCGPEVHVVANRAGCRRLADLFLKAADSPPGALSPGTAESKEFRRSFCESLVAGGNAIFGEITLDDSLGEPVGDGHARKEAAKGFGSCLLAAAAGLLLLRGAFALWVDLSTLW